MSAHFIITTEELESVLAITSPDSSTSMQVRMAVRGAAAAVRKHLGYDPVQREGTEFYPIGEAAQSAQTGVWTADGERAFFKSTTDHGELLQLARLPIRSVGGVWEDRNARAGSKAGAFAASTALTEGTQFYPAYDVVDSSGNSLAMSGILVRYGSSWPSRPGTIKVTYTAGYTAAELDGEDSTIDASGIKDAALVTAVKAFHTLKARAKSSRLGFVPGAISGEKAGDYSYTTDSGSASKTIGMTVKLPGEAIELLEEFTHWGGAV